MNKDIKLLNKQIDEFLEENKEHWAPGLITDFLLKLTVIELRQIKRRLQND